MNKQSRRKENQRVKDNSLHDRVQGNWKQLHGTVRHQWGKLTHNDVEEIKGDVEVLTGKIQVRYGVTKEEAKKTDPPVGQRIPGTSKGTCEKRQSGELAYQGTSS
jgi:uncharacterized protein YjbJ (UPF0337 family)